MTTQLLLKEARQCSAVSLALPVVAAVALLALSLAAHQMAPSRESALVGLSKFVWLLPLAQGLAAVGPLTGDRLVELHESTPVPFRRTQAHRAVIVATVSLLCSIGLYAGMQALGLWGGPGGILAILNTFGQGVFLIACAFAGAAVTHTASPVSLLVITAWIFVLFGVNAILGDVLMNRSLLMILAVALFVYGYRHLRDSERLIAGVKQ